MNCPNCGQPVEPGAAFCGNCGQPMQVAPVPGTPLPPQNPATGVSPQGSATVNPAQQFTPPPASSPTSSQAGPVVGAPLPPAGVAAPAGAMPNYNMAAPSRKGEAKAITGLILGVLSLPGALVPIVGLCLSVAAIVLASLSIRVKKVLAIIGFVFAGIGIILSILAFVYNIQHDPKLHHSNLSSDLQTVSTPCYDVKLSKSLHIVQNGCTVNAMDKSTNNSTVAYDIEGTESSQVTSSNLAAVGSKAVPSIVNAASSDSGMTFKATTQNSGTFAGAPAYFVGMAATDGGKGSLAMVYHPSAQGDNFYVITEITTNSSANVKALDPDFSWK